MMSKVQCLFCSENCTRGERVKREEVQIPNTALAKKTSARLRELAIVLGASSRNLADVFWPMLYNN